jgi:hypothetical protein
VRTYRQKYVSHQQYAEDLCSHLTRWLRRKSRRLSQEWLEAALILMRMNLEPAHPILESLYSPDPRGQKPYEPVRMLRALLLMVLLRYTSISGFAQDLKGKPRLALIAGFEPHDCPVAGSFYHFMDRLEDGPYQKPSEYQTMHRIKPSQLRKGKHLRNLSSEKEQRKKDREIDATVYDSVTKKLKDDLLASHDQPRPDDMLKRLEDILIQCAIIPSAEKGLLGNTNALTISGDGSPLPTGASPNGKPSCKCREEGIYNCKCARYYSDPTANWGYDSYREVYYFGHSYYQYVVSTNGHDLPLPPSIAPASETDYTLSMKSMDRLRKALKENGLEWKIQYAIHDAGHDSTGNYEYLMEYGIKPIIALNPRSGTYPVPTGTAGKVNENGIPLCPGGKLMRRIGFDPNRHRIYYACPVKRPTHRNGEHLYINHTDECPNRCLCQPDSKMGPVVYVKTADDPRLYPPVPRASPRYKTLMNLRSGCERSNSHKKEVYGLGKRPCRSAAHFLVRLYLISIIEHAKAWLAEDRKKQGDKTSHDLGLLIQARTA